MKTAISLPDDVFERAERLARRSGRSRSEIYATAVREYVARHEPDAVTEALDVVVDRVEEAVPDTAFAMTAGARRLRSTEW